MGAYKLNIGDATHYLKWDGAILTVKGLIGDITLNTTGFIRTSGKDSYADTTAGFWLGYDGGAYKLNIGSSVNWLKWTGSTLQIKGRLNVGGGTNEDIYFEDSGIRFYDASGTGLVFAKSGLESAFINLTAPAVVFGGLSIPRIEFYDDNKTIINCVNNAFYFYSTGTLRLPQLETAPTAHVADLTYHIDQGNNPHFHGYIGPPDNTWGKMELTAPNW